MTEELTINPSGFTPKESHLALSWAFGAGLLSEPAVNVFSAFVASRRSVLDEIADALEKRAAEIERRISECRFLDSRKELEEELLKRMDEVASFRKMVSNLR